MQKLYAGLAISCVVVFPGVSLLVKHFSGSIYIWFAVLGLVTSLSCWRELSANEKLLLKLWAGFTLFLVFTLLYSDDTRAGWKEIETYIRFLLATPLLLMLIRTRMEMTSFLLLGIFIAALVLGLYSLYSHLSMPELRVSGSYNPIKFGQLSALFAIVLLCAVIHSRYRPPVRWLMGLGFIFAMYATLASGTRSAMLTVLVCALVLLLLKAFEYSAKKNLLMLLVVGLLAAGAYAMDKQQVDNMVGRTVTEMDNILAHPSGPRDGGGLDARYSIWLDQFAMWRNEPIFGVGIGDYKKANDQLMRQGLNRSPYKYYDAHSAYLFILVVSGLVGLIFFTVVIFVIPFRLYFAAFRRHTDKKIRFVSICGLMLLMAYFCFGFADDWIGANVLVNAYLFYNCVIISILNFALRQTDYRPETG